MKNTVMSPQEYLRKIHKGIFQITDECLTGISDDWSFSWVYGNLLYINEISHKIKDLTTHQAHKILAAMGDIYPTMPSYQSYLETTDGLMVREVYFENGEFDVFPTVVARIHLDDDTLAAAVFTRECHCNVLTLRGDVSLLKGALKVISQKTLSHWNAEELQEELYNNGFGK